MNKAGQSFSIKDQTESSLSFIVFYLIVFYPSHNLRECKTYYVFFLHTLYLYYNVHKHFLCDVRNGKQYHLFLLL